MRPRAIVSILAALAVTALVPLGPAGPAGAAGDTTCPSRTHLDARTMPAGTDVVVCGLVGAWYDAGGVRLQVPAPGYAVRGHGLTAGGTGIAAPADHDARLAVARSGRLAASAASPSATARVIAPCKDSSYALWDEKWFDQVAWYVEFGHRPSNLTNAGALGALKRGMANITGEKDSCGYAGAVSLSASYKGATSTGNSVVQKKNAMGAYVISCAAGDTTSVASFGDIPSNYLAYTCDWVTYQDGPDKTLSADVRFNTHDHGFTLTGGSSGCRGRYDLESVATHEFGHLAGLGHVTGATHHNLTMYPSIYSCDIRARSLARGDVLGLRAKY